MSGHKPRYIVMCMHWGLRLRAERERQGLNQQQLAELSGVTQSAISYIEAGKALASKHVVALATALGMTAEALLHGHDTVAEDASPYALTPRHRVLLGLFDGLTSAQQDEVLRSLQAQKSLNEELLAQLLARKQPSSR